MARKRKKAEDATDLSGDVESNGVTEDGPNGTSSDFQPLLDLNPDGLLVLRPENREILYANRSVERLLRKKMKNLLAEPFPESLAEGPMQKHDLYKKPQNIEWNGEEAVFLSLVPLASQQSSFHVEWRIESAEERAKEAEQRVAELEAQLAAAPPAASPSEGLQQRIAELEAELAAVPTAELRKQIADLEARLAAAPSEDLPERVAELEEQLAEAASAAEEAQAEHLRLAEHHAAEIEHHRARVTELEAGFADASAVGAQEVERLRLQAADLESRSHQLTADLDDWRERAAHAERLHQDEAQKVATLEQSLARSSTLDDRVNELQAELARAEIRLTQMENDLSQSDARADEAERRCQEAETLMEGAESQALEAERHVEDLSDSLRQVEDELEQVNASLRASEESNARLQASLESTGKAEGAELEKLHLELAEQKVTELNLREQIEFQLSNCDELQAALQEAQTSLRDFEELPLKVEALEAELEAARQQRQQMVAELTDADTNMTALDDQIHKLTQLREEDLAELDRLRKQGEGAEKVPELEARVLELENELVAARSELAGVQQLQDELATESERAENLHGQLEQALEEQARLQARVEELLAQSEQAAQQAELDELGRQDSEQQLSSLKEESARQLEQAQQELEKERAAADEAQQKLTALEEEIERLRHRSSELETARAGDEDLRKSIETELESLKAERKAASDRVDDLKHQVSNLETRAAEAEALLEEAEERASLSEERLRDASHEVAPETAAQIESLEARLKEQTVALEAAQAAAAEATELHARAEEQSQRQAAAVQAALARAEQAEAALANAPPPPPDDSARVAQLEHSLGEHRALLAQASQAGLALEQRLHQAEQALAAAQAQAPAGGGEAPAVDPETEQLAFQDTLTGLPNLNLLKRYLDFALQQTNRYQRNSALFYIDLDRFRPLNETLGPAACNEVLLQVAERLQTVVRGSDVLARKGEDEFLILLTEVSGDPNAPGSVAVVVRRLFEVMAPPFTAGNQKVTVTCSVGVSSCPGDAADAPMMLDHSLTALRRAKQLGRNRSQFYTDEVQQQFETRVGMEKELRRAIDAQELTLLYQPIVHLPTGRLAGVETLLRWQHPTQGLLEPEHFLEAAEESGLLVPLGRWVLLQACQQLADWSQMGLDLLVTVNLSLRQFLQADLADTLQRTLEVTGAPAHSLVVEIPESVQMLDTEPLAAVINTLRRFGVQVALDHFGSGYSSLERLNVNLASILKIDRKFVRAVPQNPSATAVVTAGIVLAKSLRLKPIAVGVENEAQLALCRQMGCDFVQGNLIYVPVPGAQVAELSKGGRLLFPG